MDGRLVTSLELDPRRWAEQQFGRCDLGDVRRTRRAVEFAAQVCADPDASTPTQVEEWRDLKAAYRLIDSPGATFRALAEPHWELTRATARGVCLILGDTTELDFGFMRKIEGVGLVASNWGQGFLLHSGLMVDAASEQVLGLAGQVVHHRRPAPTGENTSQRLQRPRESEIWGELIEQIGPPRVGVQYVHVFDRGADNFEIFCRLLRSRGDWVVRAAQLIRRVLWADDEGTLETFLGQLPLAGRYELQVRANKRQPARTAKLEVRHGTVMVPASAHASPWLKACGIVLIGMNVVEVRELDPPPGAEPLRWVLLTSLPVTNFAEARRVIEYYEKRPLIEEFHKALKTGCRVEERQYQTGKRLEAITGILSVVAIRLLQLRSVSRQQPELPAKQIVPQAWVTALQSLKPKREIRTVRDFFRGLASLGGFLGRKRDGDPGWLTLWRGYEKLALALRTLRAQHQKCG
jgi:transposase-like protein/transposase Tn5 family protein